MSNKIKEFLTERKNAKIKEKIKQNTEESENQKILEELEEQFAPHNWLPGAAKRAAQLTIASHPSKFSHPDAKTSSIIAKNNKENDGYLRSGNVDYELDVFGNAAALDVYKFLSYKMDDGDIILNHLERDSAEIRVEFLAFNLNFEELKKSFLAIKNEKESSVKTDRLVKQIYFPVGDDYHLLSILTPSGLVSQTKNRIDEIRFSEKDKEAKEFRKKNEFYKDGEGYDDLFDLTIMIYGGTKPQNISILNSQNGGRAYLLPSLPPKFEKREVNLPTYNFFENVLQIKDFKNEFSKLARLIKDTRNNKEIRGDRQDLVDKIINKVLEHVTAIKRDNNDWSGGEKYVNLPKSQKIWLDNKHEDERNEDNDWAEEVSYQFAEWIIKTYEKLHNKSFEILGDAEFIYIREETKNAIL
jgi:CRISPR-associated protein Csy1